MAIPLRSARLPLFAAFRRRNFALLWLAQFISTLGSSMTTVAAALLVYRLTGSAGSVGLMLLAAALPGLFVGLFAGVVVDRFDRKRIMIAANLICALLIGAIPVALGLGSSWLYLLIALSSAVGQFFAPAQASVLPEAIPDHELAAANALMSISQYGALSIGYAGAGLIAALTSLDWAFYVDALSFVLSALCILLVQLVPLAAKEGSKRTAVAQDLRAGLVFVRDTPVLRSLVLVFVPTFTIYGFVNSLLLPFTTQSLRATEFEYGLMEGGFTVGFVVGSLVMSRVADRLHAGHWVAASLIGMGVLMVCQALAGSVLAAVTFNTLIGVLNAPSYLGRQLLIQRSTPREARGRVSSAFFVTRDSGLMLGMAVAGLADVFAVRQLLGVSALLLLGCGLMALILPGLGRPAAEWWRRLSRERHACGTLGDRQRQLIRRLRAMDAHRHIEDMAAEAVRDVQRS